MKSSRESGNNQISNHPSTFMLIYLLTWLRILNKPAREKQSHVFIHSFKSQGQFCKLLNLVLPDSVLSLVTEGPARPAKRVKRYSPSRNWGSRGERQTEDTANRKLKNWSTRILSSTCSQVWWDEHWRLLNKYIPATTHPGTNYFVCKGSERSWLPSCDLPPEALIGNSPLSSPTT